MKNTSCLRSTLIPVMFLLATFVSFSAKLSPGITTYKIKAALDSEAKTVTGEMTLTWKNPSDKPVSTLQFHLYLNAFKNSESTFVKESGGQLRGVKIDGDELKSWGSIDILKMENEQGVDLTENMRFIHPDDDNINDRTVIEVTLGEPVPPGETIALNIEFVSKLPRIFARTGFSNNYFLVAQWFPKL